MNDGRQHVAQGFTRSSLSDANKVLSRQRDGKSLGLDRSWSRESSITNLAHDIVRETTVLESHDGVGRHLLSLHDGDLVLMPRSRKSTNLTMVLYKYCIGHFDISNFGTGFWFH